MVSPWYSVKHPLTQWFLQKTLVVPWALFVSHYLTQSKDNRDYTSIYRYAYYINYTLFYLKLLID